MSAPTQLPRRPPSREVVQLLHRRALAYLSKMRRQRRHTQLWADAETFQELCELTSRFVLGQLCLTPSHGGPRDPETREIAQALAHANRAGFLTECSQPGYGRDEGGWSQRAAVQGHATDQVLERLRGIVHSTSPHGRLILQSSSVHRWRFNDYEPAVPVTVQTTLGRSASHTSFGAVPSRRQVRFEWQGVQLELVKQILGMNSVMIYDTRWGPETLLWDRLMTL